MARRRPPPNIVETDGGYKSSSSSLTVRDMKAILEKFPDEMTLWVRFPSRDFTSERCSGLSWAGAGYSILSDPDEPPDILFLQPLPPSRVQANRDYIAQQTKNRT